MLLILQILACTAASEKIKVVYIRHGQSEHNAHPEKNQDWCNAPLTSTGVQQGYVGGQKAYEAQWFALNTNGSLDKTTKISYESFVGTNTAEHLLLGSPLHRAHHTVYAHYIANFDTKNADGSTNEILVLPELRELSFDLPNCEPESRTSLIEGKNTFCRHEWQPEAFNTFYSALDKNSKPFKADLDEVNKRKSDGSLSNYKCPYPYQLFFDRFDALSQDQPIFDIYPKLFDFIFTEAKTNGYKTVFIGSHSTSFTYLANYVINKNLSADTNGAWQKYNVQKNGKQPEGGMLCNGCSALFEITKTMTKSSTEYRISDMQYYELDSKKGRKD